MVPIVGLLEDFYEVIHVKCWKGAGHRAKAHCLLSPSVQNIKAHGVTSLGSWHNCLN